MRSLRSLLCAPKAKEEVVASLEADVVVMVAAVVVMIAAVVVAVAAVVAAAAAVVGINQRFLSLALLKATDIIMVTFFELWLRLVRR